MSTPSVPLIYARGAAFLGFLYDAKIERTLAIMGGISQSGKEEVMPFVVTSVTLYEKKETIAMPRIALPTNFFFAIK